MVTFVNLLWWYYSNASLFKNKSGEESPSAEGERSKTVRVSRIFKERLSLPQVPEQDSQSDHQESKISLVQRLSRQSLQNSQAKKHSSVASNKFSSSFETEGTPSRGSFGEISSLKRMMSISEPKNSAGSLSVEGQHPNTESHHSGAWQENS